MAARQIMRWEELLEERIERLESARRRKVTLKRVCRAQLGPAAEVSAPPCSASVSFQPEAASICLIATLYIPHNFRCCLHWC